MVEEQQQETTQTTLLPQMLAHIVACVQAKRGAILRHEQGQWLLRASHTAVGKAIDITGFNLLLHEMMHTTDVKEVAHCVITSDPVLGEHTLCVLLVQHGRVSGALYLEKNAGDAPFNTAERNQTQQLAVWVMSQLENESLRFQVQETVHHLQRLREEEFVATKQRFLTNISHELRTPLNAIIGYAELVRDNLQALSQPQLVADLQRIEHSAWHLLDLINDLLNMARIERGDVAVHTTTFDLLDVTKEETEKFRAFAKQNNSQITLEAPAEMTMTWFHFSGQVDKLDG
jgi:signal transduction histidine kinase